MNAAKRPWRTLWRKGAVPPAARHALRYARGYRLEMLGHLGGADEASFPEVRLAEIAATAAACSALITEAAMQEGLVVRGAAGSAEISPALRELPRFLLIETKALQALGLKRKAKTIQSLAEYMAARAAAVVDVPLVEPEQGQP